mgnify:CR=1 FL=1
MIILEIIIIRVNNSCDLIILKKKLIYKKGNAFGNCIAILQLFYKTTKFFRI